jgi:excisionase family DNA binding protein
MTVREVARLLGVSAGLVYSLVAAGKIRHERHGLGRGTIRIPSDAVAEYRLACTFDGTTAATERRPWRGRFERVSPFFELDPTRLERAWKNR